MKDGANFHILNFSHTVEKNGFTEITMSMVSHTGTHIDAHCHLLEGARSLDQFPMEKFSGKALVIPCPDKIEISFEYLLKFEETIRKVDFILFFTGWQNKWNTPEYFMDCPVPTREAAIWLSAFNLKGIGVDALSHDKIGTAAVVNEENLPNHHIFLRKEILLIENLTNLDKIPDGIFSFQCFPLKIENADCSPIRALAIL